MRDKNLGDMPKINRKITSPEIRLIDQNEAMVGVVTLSEALRMALAAGLDLIEIVPNASPPVCKIMGFDKYRYEKQKQSRQNSQSKKKMKEIKLGVSIGDHDFEVKINHALDFLKTGHAIKCIVQMKGRELVRRESGRKMIDRVIARLENIAKLHGNISTAGNQVIAILFPVGDK